ncbi:Sod [Cordylochernes scorpioides]|uniref:Superoxide dismutase [Cu-Zn] n=1 Tax=Cordylochernes scorpioides TaxID=51811 RepID=A0ABY6KB48_9ARAC|nr:Sod [Cordylochernes scorpioides]UYV66073.1 Sod [Cordylochernes scorpioides]
MKAVCTLNGPVQGRIWFQQAFPDSPVEIVGEVSGLSPGDHGMHVHELGDTTGGCSTTGAHFNPEKSAHGGPTDRERHLGDLGNITVDPSDGLAHVSLSDNRITLYGQNSILGRSLVIHEDRDDLGRGGHELSKVTGNSGTRIACGVIGICPEDESTGLSLT